MVTNGKYKFTFYVDGAETAFVMVHPSQKDRFSVLMSRLCRYATKFGYNVQYDTKMEVGEWTVP